MELQAECKVLHRQPMCICPPGFTGNAKEACYPSHYYFASRSGLPISVSNTDDSPIDNEENVTTTINGFYGEPVPTLATSREFESEKESESFKLSLPID